MGKKVIQIDKIFPSLPPSSLTLRDLNVRKVSVLIPLHSNTRRTKVREDLDSI